MTSHPETHFDVVIMGAGAVAENVADRIVQGGLSAVVIENELVGGDCSYWACMPSKALIRSGMALRAAKRLAGSREAVTGELDVAAVLARRNSFTHDWDDESQVGWLEHTGIALVRGHGRLSAAREVTVTASDGTITVLTAKHAVVVCTGSDPMLPDIPGLRDAEPWTPREATSAQEAPASLVIIGGGVVAVEMATAYVSFGTTVTILTRSGLLQGQEDFAGDLVAASLRELGVDIRKAAPTAVEKTAAGFAITVDGEVLEAEKLLVATGRVPRSSDIGMEIAGLTPGDWITVDDTLKVIGSDWLYAAGDINHRALLTHQGKYQARICGDVILGKTITAWADHVAVPGVVFTDPQIGSVGLTEAKAVERGLDVRTVRYETGHVAAASARGTHTVGTSQLVIDRARNVVVGATFVGPEIGELVHAATIAIVGEVTLDRLWHAVPAFPTMSELWLRLLEAAGL